MHMLITNSRKNDAAWGESKHVHGRSHYPGRASALDFKDIAALQFGHSDVKSVLKRHAHFYFPP